MGPAQPRWASSRIVRIARGEVYQVGLDHTLGSDPKPSAEITSQAHRSNLEESAGADEATHAPEVLRELGYELGVSEDWTPALQAELLSQPFGVEPSNSPAIEFQKQVPRAG